MRCLKITMANNVFFPCQKRIKMGAASQPHGMAITTQDFYNTCHFIPL